jgi:hypothetical protein
MRGRFFTAAWLRQLQPVGVPSRAARAEATVEAAGPMHDPDWLRATRRCSC